MLAPGRSTPSRTRAHWPKSPWSMFLYDPRNTGNAATPQPQDGWFLPLGSKAFDDQLPGFLFKRQKTLHNLWKRSRSAFTG